MAERTERAAEGSGNAAADDWDLASTETLLRRMHDEDRRAVAAVEEVLPAVARVVDLVAARLRAGGRLLLYGAGTSGRLAVLDASELPPTFGVPPTLVRAFIAGGDRALRDALEGAEDDASLARKDVADAEAGPKDVVLAVAASGRTPYALAALDEARRRGAATVALVCDRPTPAHARADHVIDPRVGPEILAGSTRLKAGTAQKLVLNMISTGAMTRLGRTYGGLMVGVAPTNAKLRARAVGLTAKIAGVDEAAAAAALRAAGDDVRVACVMLRRCADAAAARALLDAAGGSLRAVIG